MTKVQETMPPPVQTVMMPEIPEHKPGWQSTAFWMAAIAKIVSIALVVLSTMEVNPTVKLAEIVVGGIAAVLTALGYMKNNKDVKVARAPSAYLIK